MTRLAALVTGLLLVPFLGVAAASSGSGPDRLGDPAPPHAGPLPLRGGLAEAEVLISRLQGSLLAEGLDLRALEAAALEAVIAYVREVHGPESLGLTTDSAAAVSGPEDGILVGVGLELVEAVGGGVPVVRQVMEGGAAADAGLAPGDALLTVDGVSAVGASTAWLHGALQGAEGSSVTLELARGPQQALVVLRRKALAVPSVRAVMLLPEVGLLRIERFCQGTALEVSRALAELRSLGMAGLVLDLRANDGGPLRPALEAADAFLAPRLPLVELHGPASAQRIQSRHPPEFEGPLMVLVDEGTSGSAEALAWALRSNRRAPLMGRPTAGQNLGFSSVALGSEVRAQLPVVEYRDASGGTWAAGLQPDYEEDAELSAPSPEHVLGHAAGWVRKQLREQQGREP